MNRIASLIAWTLVLALARPALPAEGVNPANLSKPPVDSWPTYNGDYSGRRFSPLTKINESNVDSLSLAWVYRIEGRRGPVLAGVIKATPLVVDGIMYFTVPDNVWAIDARTGRRTLALRMAIERRHPSRQSRRGHLWQLALLRNARLQSRLAEYQGWQGALEQADLRSRPDVLRVRRAAS